MERNTGCPTGTDDGTERGTRRGTDALRCWVQNQNQNQSSSTAVCGVSINQVQTVKAVEGQRRDGLDLG